MEWFVLGIALILFLGIPFAVVLIFRHYFKHLERIQLMGSQSRIAGKNLPLKLQALERLTLLCSRIDLVDMILRLQAPDTSAHELKSALLLTVQQEFEHNITQQLYVSEALWNVLKQAQSQTMDIIVAASLDLPHDATAAEYARRLIDQTDSENTLPNQIAIKAIRAEASLYL